MGIRIALKSAAAQNAIRHVFNEGAYVYPSDWFTEMIELRFKCKVVSYSIIRPNDTTGYQLEFENEHDATMFILRWS